MSLKKKLLIVSAIALTSVGTAQAALDASVGTAVAGTSADITEAGTLMIGLAVVAMGVRWVKATFF